MAFAPEADARRLQVGRPEESPGPETSAQLEYPWLSTMLPKSVEFSNGEFSFADAHDEAYYRATRFESLYTFQVVFSLFCLAQELGVIAHHVVAHPTDRSLILLLLPLLALSSATLAVRLALHHLWPKHSPARAQHIYIGTQITFLSVTVLLYNTVVNTAVGSAFDAVLLYLCLLSTVVGFLAATTSNATRLLLLFFFALAPNLAPLFTDVITARQEQALALIAAFIGGGSALLVDYVARVRSSTACSSRRTAAPSRRRPRARPGAAPHHAAPVAPPVRRSARRGGHPRR